jgi:pyrroline-5-carboxylate reductase
MAIKIGFLGTGRLASAIIRGLLAKKVFIPSEIGCTSKSGKSAALLSDELGIAHLSDLAELLRPAEIVILAFKPQSLANADPALAELTRGKLVISLLAGKRLETLKRYFPAARNIVRTMTNTPAAIGAGITSFCAHEPLAADDLDRVEKILGALGQYLALPEGYFDAVTGLSGSGPGLVFEFADALCAAGVNAGLPPDIATRLGRETLIGAAMLMAQSGLSPVELRDQVVSPNGTTAAGLAVFAQQNLRQVVTDSVRAASERSKALSAAN